MRAYEIVSQVSHRVTVSTRAVSGIAPFLARSSSIGVTLSLGLSLTHFKLRYIGHDWTPSPWEGLFRLSILSICSPAKMKYHKQKIQIYKGQLIKLTSSEASIKSALTQISRLPAPVSRQSTRITCIVSGPCNKTHHHSIPC